jgi:hypothetical protein
MALPLLDIHTLLAFSREIDHKRFSIATQHLYFTNNNNPIPLARPFLFSARPSSDEFPFFITMNGPP